MSRNISSFVCGTQCKLAKRAHHGPEAFVGVESEKHHKAIRVDEAVHRGQRVMGDVIRRDFPI
jgi:hypothetical protein